MCASTRCSSLLPQPGTPCPRWSLAEIASTAWKSSRPTRTSAGANTASAPYTCRCPNPHATRYVLCQYASRVRPRLAHAHDSGRTLRLFCYPLVAATVVDRSGRAHQLPPEARGFVLGADGVFPLGSAVSMTRQPQTILGAPHRFHFQDRQSVAWKHVDADGACSHPTAVVPAVRTVCEHGELLAAIEHTVPPEPPATSRLTRRRVDGNWHRPAPQSAYSCRWTRPHGAPPQDVGARCLYSVGLFTSHFARACSCWPDAANTLTHLSVQSADGPRISRCSARNTSTWQRSWSYCVL